MKAKPRSLLNEVQFFIILISMAIVFVALGVSLLIVSRTMLTDLQNRSIETAEQMAAFLEYPLYAVDEEQAVRVAQTFLSSGRISGITLASTANGILLDKSAGRDSPRIPKISREIYKDGLLLGKITISFSGAEIIRTQTRFGIIFLVIIVAVLLVNLAANRFFIAQKVRRPFDAIISAMRKIAEGDYETLIAPTPYRDVNIIVSHFNDMAGRIHRKNQKQKQAEEALRKSEDKYRTIAETTADWIWEIDRAGRHKYSNPEVKTLLGYQADEIIGQSALSFLHEQDRKIVKEALPRLIAEKRGWRGWVLRWRHKDGTYRYLESNGSPIINPAGELVGYLGADRDITERKQAEDALRAERRFLMDIIDFLPDATFVIDTDRRIVAWNRAAEAMTGVKRDALLGQGDYAYAVPFFGDRRPILIDFLDAPDEEREEFYKYIRRSGTTLYGESFIQRLNEGRGAHLWGVAAPLYDHSGARTGAIEMIRDVTEYKQAEEEKIELQRQLLQAQKMESVGRLAGGVAHDYNNMLSVILGQTELAMFECIPSGSIYAALETIQTAAQRSADLTRKLLAFARRQIAAPKVINMNETVASMLDMLLRMIGEDLNLVWAPSADLWPVKIDPTQVDQILANLCVNARDAIAGVGKITIETQNIFFDEAYCEVHPGYVCGEYAMLSVSDDGCGMSKEVLDRLFEPFFTTKQLGKGTGLGLATVYGIVKQNEGFINVYSEPGEGTTFKVYIPRYLGDAKETSAQSIPEISQGNGEMVLLVEDEPMILDVNRTMLEKLGYTVLTAGTPGNALLLAKAHAAELQLLITDVVMPEMNGRDLAESIYAIKPGIKCLFTSGYTANAIAHRAMLDQNVHFLQKPFSMNDLAAKVRLALGDE